MRLKTCSSCKETKPITSFGIHKQKKDGYNYQCKSCRKTYASAWYSRNKSLQKRRVKQSNIRHREKSRGFILKHLQQNHCVDCGERDPIVLDFDHTRETKDFNVSHAVSMGYAMSRIEKEIKKCEVRCANCHRRKTARDIGSYKYRCGLGLK